MLFSGAKTKINPVSNKNRVWDWDIVLRKRKGA
ncbi:MAG: hypothetical protein ACI956_000532, partial [Nonlabens sp.]